MPLTYRDYFWLGITADGDVTALENWCVDYNFIYNVGEYGVTVTEYLSDPERYKDIVTKEVIEEGVWLRPIPAPTLPLGDHYWIQASGLSGSGNDHYAPNSRIVFGHDGILDPDMTTIDTELWYFPDAYGNRAIRGLCGAALTNWARDIGIPGHGNWPNYSNYSGVTMPFLYPPKGRLHVVGADGETTGFGPIKDCFVKELYPSTLGTATEPFEAGIAVLRDLAGIFMGGYSDGYYSGQAGAEMINLPFYKNRSKVSNIKLLKYDPLGSRRIYNNPESYVRADTVLLSWRTGIGKTADYQNWPITYFSTNAENAETSGTVKRFITGHWNPVYTTGAFIYLYGLTGACGATETFNFEPKLNTYSNIRKGIEQNRYSRDYITISPLTSMGACAATDSEGKGYENHFKGQESIINIMAGTSFANYNNYMYYYKESAEVYAPSINFIQHALPGITQTNARINPGKIHIENGDKQKPSIGIFNDVYIEEFNLGGGVVFVDNQADLSIGSGLMDSSKAKMSLNVNASLNIKGFTAGTGFQIYGWPNLDISGIPDKSFISIQSDSDELEAYSSLNFTKNSLVVANKSYSKL